MVAIHTIHTTHTHTHPPYTTYIPYTTYTYIIHTHYIHTLKGSLTEKQSEPNSEAQDFLLARFPLPLKSAKTLEVPPLWPKNLFDKDTGLVCTEGGQS